MSLEKTILVNQIGYKTVGRKFALLRKAKGDEIFYIKDDSGNIVFEGQAGKAVQDRIDDYPVSLLDFSSFKQEGTFKIVTDEDESHPFVIENSPYNNLYYSILNYYSLSRCGEKITDKNPDDKGIWNHEACHTGIAEIYGEKGKTKNVQGGWHDAGDYGRYVVAGTKTVMDILRAYEYSKDKFTKFDILEEARFELEWLLQMQREDGAVYHKISCYHFCSFILPEQEKDKLVLAPVSTSATADFAGCAAFASEFYKQTDPEFAKKLVDAALKAQEYLDSNEDLLYKNPPEITTGGYGDWNVRDERFFALCALFVQTKNKTFLQKAKSLRAQTLALPKNPAEPWKNGWFEAFGWGCVTTYGTEILLKNQELVDDKKFIDDLKSAIKERADGILKRVNSSGYKSPLFKVIWGSNGQVCDEAHICLLAYDLFGNEEYLLAAEYQLNYILGCNPLDLCYVSGFGSRTVMNPHHRPSGAVKAAMPGMLAGGPSEGLQDEAAKKYLQGKAPLSCYIDNVQSFSTNEVAIYWNSPLVYLTARVGL